VRKTLWRSFKTAAWLGWQIESNWTKPLLFTLYSIVKPLAFSGILVVLYATVTKGDFASPVFASMYVGNAFFMYVGAVMTGMAYAVIDDRERYQTLRSIYVAPIDIRWYLAGRGVARFVAGSASVLVTMVFGLIFLHVPLHVRGIHWALFLAALATGIVMLAMMGLALAGVILLLPHQSWSIGEAVAGALYLFSGAIFPLDVLPRVLRPIAFAMPVAYWLELLRRALLGPAASLRTFSGRSNFDLFGVLLGLTAALAVTALLAFRRCDWIARERGLIDRTTAF
jgi:ABC-2 type transport system permease protein